MRRLCLFFLEEIIDYIEEIWGFIATKIEKNKKPVREILQLSVTRCV
jgi:hypothetical protein